MLLPLCKWPQRPKQRDILSAALGLTPPEPASSSSTSSWIEAYSFSRLMKLARFSSGRIWSARERKMLIIGSAFLFRRPPSRRTTLMVGRERSANRTALSFSHPLTTLFWLNARLRKAVRIKVYRFCKLWLLRYRAVKTPLTRHLWVSYLWSDEQSETRRAFQLFYNLH